MSPDFQSGILFTRGIRGSNPLRSTMKYYCDKQRHLVCVPYSKENLHLMAAELGIKRCWFHKDHYDIPKKRIDEISSKCEIVSSRKILEIIMLGSSNG